MSLDKALFKHTTESTIMITTVKDIMTSQVQTVRDAWSIKQLAEFFFENNVSGAPVLDEYGKLLGVVSVTDLVRFDSQHNEETQTNTHDVYTHHLEKHFAKEEIAAFQIEDATSTTVHDIMTPMVFDVDESTTIQQAADIMVKGHIHRVFVTNNKKVVGVVSALDMLKVLR